MLRRKNAILLNRFPAYIVNQFAISNVNTILRLRPIEQRIQLRFRWGRYFQ